MEKKSVLDRLFPTKYDFYDMLDKQARANAAGINALCSWLSSASAADGESLLQYVKDADDIRIDMEKNLIEAFSTPFDRGDIYSISVGMDKIIEYAKSTLLSMNAYGIPSNDVIVGMVGKLQEGVCIFSESMESLKSLPAKAGQNIAPMRETHVAVEQLYREGMAAVFKSGDPMYALKQREVYHHIKDASSSLDDAVDILHRIVVRLT